MKFIQPCFIRKNTPELIKSLEVFGYKYLRTTSGEYISRDNIRHGGRELFYNCIACDSHRFYYAKPKSLEVRINKYNFNCIDCGTNEDLFLAIAALSDDTDRYQWFITNQNEWYKSIYDNEYRHEHNRTINGVEIGIRTVRKATIEELIEHFKEQEQ